MGQELPRILLLCVFPYALKLDATVKASHLFQYHPAETISTAHSRGANGVEDGVPAAPHTESAILTEMLVELNLIASSGMFRQISATRVILCQVLG